MNTNEPEQPIFCHRCGSTLHNTESCPCASPPEPMATPELNEMQLGFVGLIAMQNPEKIVKMMEDLTASRAEVERLTKGNDALVRQLGIIALEREATEPKALRPTETPIVDKAEYQAFIENGPIRHVVSGCVARTIERRLYDFQAERDTLQVNLRERTRQYGLMSTLRENANAERDTLRAEVETLKANWADCRAALMAEQKALANAREDARRLAFTPKPKWPGP